MVREERENGDAGSGEEVWLGRSDAGSGEAGGGVGGSKGGS